MFGGTDPTNLSLMASELMRPLDAVLDINFVAPQRNLDSIRKNLPENRANIRILSPKIQDLLAKADVVFSAAGTSVLDISCIGIPSIYISIAENQNVAIDSINEFELGVTVRSEVERELFGNQILGAIKACLFDQQLRERVFTNSQKLVDGLGARRVVQYIEKTAV
jgi:spore coat polysaccharide biosynthesis predicted glycosyltransferase SpsG